ncbi:adenine deaminase [Chloroflexota bacterium]
MPADLILANTRVVNVFTGEVELGNVAISKGKIAGVGDYHKARKIIDLSGKYLAPGLINGHTHMESSMLNVGQYARAVVPRGTLGIVTDLHEVANVSGIDGMRYVLEQARHLPLEMFLMAPSCVPATHLETSGANITPEEIHRILRWRECIGLGEVMNVPGVINGDENMLGKIKYAHRMIIDGHAPGLRGKNLSAYIAAGIKSDHESVTLEEAEDKLKQGVYLMIREGSSEKNLDALLPLVTDKTYKRCLFVVDDRNCSDLLRDGDIDAVVRKAIKRGLNPIRAIQLATINPAERFRLDNLGAIAPGYTANMIVFSDLSKLDIKMVFYHGQIVAEDGRTLFKIPETDGKSLRKTMNIKPFSIEALDLPIKKGENLSVIELVPGQIITKKTKVEIKAINGVVVSDTDKDILKLVVIERHRKTGNIGLGMVKGFGLKRGAIASSIAHDSHNIIATGTSDEEIFTAIKEVEKLQGGLVVKDDKTTKSLALPVAGLLSDKSLEMVVDKLEEIEDQTREQGATMPSPFAALSFLALPVIPELRLTDLGLVDVNEFKIIK